MTLSLALLSPRIVRAIVEARLPEASACVISASCPLPGDAQERILGL